MESKLRDTILSKSRPQRLIDALPGWPPKNLWFVDINGTSSAYGKNVKQDDIDGVYETIHQKQTSLIVKAAFPSGVVIFTCLYELVYEKAIAEYARMVCIRVHYAPDDTCRVYMDSRRLNENAYTKTITPLTVLERSLLVGDLLE
jgi:hypothetical protein